MSIEITGQTRLGSGDDDMRLSYGEMLVKALSSLAIMLKLIRKGMQKGIGRARRDISPSYLTFDINSFERKCFSTFKKAQSFASKQPDSAISFL